MNILVINCGSSSIKYKLFAMPKARELASGSVERIGESEGRARQKSAGGELEMQERIADHKEGLEVIVRMLTDEGKGAVRDVKEIDACGHRVVHAAEKFVKSMLIDDAVLEAVRECNDLAPLHNPPNLMGIEAARALSPDMPQVACFDTAFHQSIPRKAFLYALPYELYEEHRVRRYGFHGTSHRYVMQRAAVILGKSSEETSLITCHLGNGCSMAAIKNGQCVDTSMGMTPLEGLVMGTRSGDLDPAILFYLHRRGYSLEDLDTMLNRKSGLLGISGVSNDMRNLSEEAASGNARAELALEMFAYRIRKYIGSYLATLNGCDAIVMTGGVGENATPMRARILNGLDTLGIVLDNAQNAASSREERAISADTSPIRILVIPTDEEAAIAHDTSAIVSGDA